MSGIWAVIRREFLERVRTKWFIISTLGIPVLMAGMITLPIVLGRGAQDSASRFVIVDRTGQLYPRLAEILTEGGIEVSQASATDEAELADLEQRLSESDIGAVLVVDDETMSAGRASLMVRSAPSAIRSLSIRGAIVQAALEARLDGDRAAVDALLQGGDLDVRVTDAEGAGLEDPEFLSIYFGTMLLYAVILIYAGSVMRSTLEEKTSRIVEVIISSIRPWHLMLGKILGVGAVGLVQVAVWTTAVLVITVMGLPALIAAQPELTQLSDMRQLLPDLGFLGLFFIYFLGGYFMYSAIYAAVGAMVNSEQEAQQVQLPVVMLLVVPVVLLIEVMQNPSSLFATGMSLFPLFSPILMFARASAGGAPIWQIVLSVVLMSATVVAIAWVAGRIYKVGILMAGKRPTLPN